MVNSSCMFQSANANLFSVSLGATERRCTVGCGIGNSGIWTFSQTLAGPHAVGRWTGLQNGFANLAGVVGPALTGFIVDWTGHFQVALVITAGVSLLSGISWVFLVGRFEPVIWITNTEPLIAVAEIP